MKLGKVEQLPSEGSHWASISLYSINWDSTVFLVRETN